VRDASFNISPGVNNPVFDPGLGTFIGTSSAAADIVSVGLLSLRPSRATRRIGRTFRSSANAASNSSELIRQRFSHPRGHPGVRQIPKDRKPRNPR
jgi:hypothetical protein